jgi:hypothetical protein
MLSIQPSGRGFPPRHRFDQAFFWVMVLLAWAAILSGFLYKNVNKFMEGTLTYPWVVHLHGILYSLWLIYFTAQVLLIGRGSVSLHRKLGPFGAALAAVMVVSGVYTGIVTESLRYGKPYEATILSGIFADMICFGSLVTAGILLRGSPAAHKRLMLVATLGLTVAGFGRWMSPAIDRWLGVQTYWVFPTFSEGAWPFIRFQVLPAYTLIVAIGVYDLFTRRRLHPAYVAAVAWCLPIQLFSGWLYYQPFWNQIARRILGH